MDLEIESWGLGTDDSGGLAIGGVSAEALTREFGSPLHVVDEGGLRCRAARLRRAFESAYRGEVSVHYALKCNSTPGIVAAVLSEGLRPEVGTMYEWRVSRELGVPARDIIVNGPNKGHLLTEAVREGAAAIVVDSLEELARIEAASMDASRPVRILLRINPDHVPRGMNRASATGSRKASVFGLDLHSHEVAEALRRLVGSSVRFVGFHMHVGTGIRHPDDYRVPLDRLAQCALQAARLDLTTEMLDVGGGFGVATSRELTTSEFLVYQALGHLPRAPRPEGALAPERFAEMVGETVQGAFEDRGLPLPRILVEPGRSVVSQSGVLLITVGLVKERPGAGTWVVTDGGAGTVAFPLFYEYHEIFRCRTPRAPRTRRFNLVGSACHSADWVYRNKRMPALEAGDVLAICDAGAYFTVQESNFGYPRPAIVAIRDGEVRLMRRRETFDDMVARDMNWRDSPCCLSGLSASRN